MGQVNLWQSGKSLDLTWLGSLTMPLARMDRHIKIVCAFGNIYCELCVIIPLAALKFQQS